MKSITTTLLILLLTTPSFSQSKSFITLKEKFSGSEDVFSFHTSGFMARTILWMAGEHEFTDAVKDIKSIRLIRIPKASFREHDVTLAGFLKVAKKDSFEELAHMRDRGDDVRILLQSPKQKKGNNHYLVLVDDNDEVVVIEVKGYIEPNTMIAYH